MKMKDEKEILGKLLGQKVKVLYSDEDQTKKVVGTLNKITEQYMLVNDVIVGLGPSFISCIPIKERTLHNNF